MRRRIAPLSDFLNRESTSGLLILLASALGLITANSPLSERYVSTLDFKITLGADWYLIDLSILKVINYLLMSIFFFVVGLEIKRELTSGHLASVKKAMLPFVAAIGGMAIPALIYLAIAGGVAPGGWGVPVATDIALAVGLLTMIGPSVTASLRSFLLALAVIDDIGAILVIAFVYSTGINFSWLAAAALSIGLIAALKKAGVESVLIYSLFAFTFTTPNWRGSSICCTQSTPSADSSNVKLALNKVSAKATVTGPFKYSAAHMTAWAVPSAWS